VSRVLLPRCRIVPSSFLRIGLPALVLICACESSPETRARELFPDRSRTLAAERPFRVPAGMSEDARPGTCPSVLEDVASGTSLKLRGWAQIEERRREGTGEVVTRWQKGYYVAVATAAASLAAGEEYVIRCDRMAGSASSTPLTH
jgi:hypothetical protein